MEGKTFHITKAKLKQLQKEHDELVVFEHKKMVGEEAPKILQSEDLNPEFVSYQEDMGQLRARIDELQDILDHHVLIKKPAKEKQTVVDLGAMVHVETGGKKNEFMIVGTLEANPDIGKISNESPVGKALLGRKIGDEITINASSKKVYKIRDIKYEVG